MCLWSSMIASTLPSLSMYVESILFLDVNTWTPPMCSLAPWATAHLRQTQHLTHIIPLIQIIRTLDIVQDGATKCLTILLRPVDGVVSIPHHGSLALRLPAQAPGTDGPLANVQLHIVATLHTAENQLAIIRRRWHQTRRTVVFP